MLWDGAVLQNFFVKYQPAISHQRTDVVSSSGEKLSETLGIEHSSPETCPSLVLPCCSWPGHAVHTHWGCTLLTQALASVTLGTRESHAAGTVGPSPAPITNHSANLGDTGLHLERKTGGQPTPLCPPFLCTGCHHTSLSGTTEIPGKSAELESRSHGKHLGGTYEGISVQSLDLIQNTDKAARNHLMAFVWLCVIPWRAVAG